MARSFISSLIPFTLTILVFCSGCHDSISEETIEPVVPVLGPYDTMMVPPKGMLPDPPPFDDMLGDYTGDCSRYSYEFDFSNGETTTTWDSISVTVSINEIIPYLNHPYRDDLYEVITSGPNYPFSFLIPEEELLSDSIYLSAGQGGSISTIIITPSRGELSLGYRWNAPYGPGSLQLNCTCLKK